MLWLKKKKLNLSVVEGHSTLFVIKRLINIHHRPCCYDTERNSWEKKLKNPIFCKHQNNLSDSFWQEQVDEFGTFYVVPLTFFTGEVCPGIASVQS